jgi:hypothetical protein
LKVRDDLAVATPDHDDELFNAVRRQVEHDPLDDGPSEDRKHGFGAVSGERVQPSALSRCEYYTLHITPPG